MSIRNVKYRHKVHRDAFTEPYTVALLHFDESVTKDECGNTWTIDGSPTISETNAKFGKALYFSGNGLLKLNCGITLGGQDFTIDFWAYPLLANYCWRRYLCFSEGLGDTNGKNLGYLINLDANPSTTRLAVAKTYITLNRTWANQLLHYAIIYEHSQQKASLYVQGNLVVEKTCEVFPRVKLNYVYIGNYTGDSNASRDNSFKYHGHIDEFRISDGIARWTENFTPPTSPYVATIPAYDSIDVANIKFYDKPAIKPNIALNGPGGSHTYAGLVPPNLKRLVQKTKVLPTADIDEYTKALLHFDESATKDECGNTWLNNGSSKSTISITNAKFGTALQLKALNQYGDITLGGQDFTIDFWLYIASGYDTTSTAALVFQVRIYQPSSNYLDLVHLNRRRESQKFSFGTHQLSDKLSNADVIDQLMHIAIVYQNSQNTCKLFVNGQLDTTLNNSNSLSRQKFAINIWAVVDGVTIDEFRISDGIARWTENFTPPIHPYGYVEEVEDETNYTTPIALLHFDNPDKPLFDEVLENQWKSVGNPAIVSWLSKFNNCLALTKGQQVYNELLSLSNTDFTVDFWGRFMDGNGYLQIHGYEYVYNSDYPSEYVSNVFYWNVSNGVFKFGAGFGAVDFTGAYRVHDMMNHYAIVYKKSSNTYYCYFNGQLTGTLQSNSYNMSTGEPIQTYTIPVTHGISNVKISVIDGTTYIDEFRITPGVVWDSDFTPPNKPMNPEYEPIPNPIASDIQVHTEDYDVLAIATKKKTPTLVLSDTELTLAEKYDEQTVTINTDSDGDFNVWTNNSELLSITRDANSFTVKNIGGKGSALVFVQVLEGREYEASEAVSINVGAYQWGALNEHTAQEISWANYLGIAQNLWDVGDQTAPIPISKFAVGGVRKLVPSTNGYIYKYFYRYINAGEYPAYVLGFNHNLILEHSNFNDMHFMLGLEYAFVDGNYGSGISQSDFSNVNTPYDLLHHRNSNTNGGGWEKSVIRNTLLPKLQEKMPMDWWAPMTQIKKYTDNRTADEHTSDVTIWNGYRYVTDTSGITGTYDFLFLLSEYEVFGDTTHSHPGEAYFQEQYDFFKRFSIYADVYQIHPEHAPDPVTKKVKYDNTDTACKWWLRSPKLSNKTQYCRVDEEGQPSYGNAKVSSGIVACFVIS